VPSRELLLEVTEAGRGVEEVVLNIGVDEEEKFPMSEAVE
jgi:hypothetical protein